MLGLAFAGSLAAQELKLQVLCTSETRGAILPEDPYTRQPRPGGWAKLATLIKARQAAQPTLLVDLGHALQGEPSSAIRTRTLPTLQDPAIAIMNALGYHGMALGPQDFSFGLAAVRSMEEQAQFPLLSATLQMRETGKLAFAPYALHEIQGVRVAILGLTGPQHADPSLVTGDLTAAARAYVTLLRDKEKADLILVTLQNGLGTARQLAEQVKGIDLLLLANTLERAPADLAGVPVLQAESLGRSLGRAAFDLRKERGRWTIAHVATERLPLPTETPQDPQVLELTRALREKADAYLDTLATQLQVDLDGRWCRMEDTPLAQLLHTVAREATGADLTAVPVPSPRYFVPAGPTSVRQFWALAPSEDPLAIIRIRGSQLKAYLEHAARTFASSHALELFNKAIPVDEVDLVHGCTFALDLGAPIGRRITRLRVNGKPVDPEQDFTLTLPASRLRGQGGYLQAMDWKGTPISTAPQSFRNLLLGHVLAHPNLSPASANHWRTVPYLDRERVAAQQ